MIDRVEIFVQGGDGGAGAVSFRREKFVPRGGPDGGDGGQGGDVILQASSNVSTLAELRYRRRYRAESGRAGTGQRMHGRSGPDLIVAVPVGTEVHELGPDGSSAVIADLDESGASFIAGRGGLGGRGNSRFATATNQAPRVAERGQKAVGRELRLDLKLLADVGLVGLPNAGKSTFLAAVTSARPKIADYPFTTLEPVLGVVEHGDTSYVIADIPGLIEGAHAGVGLGFEFLQHVERTAVLVHIIDGSAADPLTALETVERELTLFAEGLAHRPYIVVLNKIDLPEVSARAAGLLDELKGSCEDVFAISAAARLGLSPLMDRIAQRVSEHRLAKVEARRATAAEPVIRPQPRAPLEVLKERDAFRIYGGRRLEAMAEMLDLSDDEAWVAFHQRLQRLGGVAALKRAGVREGDPVRIGATETVWRD
jgi:GTP-binding protein